MEFLNALVGFIEYLVENYGVVIWTVLAYVIVAYSRELKNEYLAGKIDTEFENFIYRLVLAAEEYIVNGDEKYEWVSKSIKKYAPEMTDDEIRIWIDSTVRLIKAEELEKAKDANAISEHSDEGLSKTASSYHSYRINRKSNG